MEPKDVLPAVIRGSGKSMRTISQEIGRSDNFLSATLQRPNVTPRLLTMAEIANACNYDFKLINRNDGTEIIINPPSKDD